MLHAQTQKSNSVTALLAPETVLVVSFETRYICCRSVVHLVAGSSLAGQVDLDDLIAVRYASYLMQCLGLCQGNISSSRQ